MKIKKFENYIKEEVDINDWADYHSFYVAIKDTIVNDADDSKKKIKVLKGTVFSAVGGGYYKNSDETISTGIKDLENSNFKKIPDPIWATTTSLTDKIEDFARNSIRMAKISPNKIESIIAKTMEILGNIENTIDDARENELFFLKEDPYGEEKW